MNERRPIAFYAPLKAPDDAVPSGDRRMARLLLGALMDAGFAPFVASRLRAYEGGGNRAAQDRIRDAARREAERLASAFIARPADERPQLWFTYHVYYKAPDWIGPAVATRLGIPYVVAEGSRAQKRAHGPWRASHDGAEAALDRAAVVFILNDDDRPALEQARPPRQSLVDLPPFIDVHGDTLPPCGRGRAAPLLLTVAMMRQGDKLASYRLLAEALARIEDKPWRLNVVGAGDARAEVEQVFARVANRTTFHGLVEDEADLTGLYGEADLFVWPAVNEAYGMVFLEAQAQGCPAVGGRFGGVPRVVRHGETGLLAAPSDPVAFAEAVASLLADPARRLAMGEAARRFVRSERTVAQTAAILRAALLPLVAARVVA